jgi:SAM-dependent methyltransferase
MFIISMSLYDPIARFYDADHGEFDQDLQFYLELAHRTGGPVLEAMCGSGRLLMPLAEAGYQVAGTDTSQAMLDLAQTRLNMHGVSKRAALTCVDIREPAPGGRYALAIIALNSFMHLTTTEDQLGALGALHESLLPGGILALDLFNPNPRLLAEYDNELVFDKAFTLEDGAQVQKYVAQQIDAATQINTVNFIYDEVGADHIVRRYTASFEMRWTYRYELEHLLERSGFALEQVYGSYELDPYRSDSDIMLAVARRL